MENPSLLADQKYQLVPLKKLTPHPDNVRMGNVDAIGQSITANQFYGALIVQRSTGHILAGNHRYLAAKEQGLDKVPVIWLDVDDEKALKILLVDNRTNDLAGNNEEKLAAILVNDYTGTKIANFMSGHRYIHSNPSFIADQKKRQENHDRRKSEIA